MNTHQQLLLQLDDWVTVIYAGDKYHVAKYDRTPLNYPHPPSWNVQRNSDLRHSKRYYSRPEGAITALLTGAIVWIN